MTTRGFEEAQSTYMSDDGRGLVGQFRRFGEEGPAYEVLRVMSRDEVVISVLTSEEELAYPIAEVLADPIAVTIP